MDFKLFIMKKLIFMIIVALMILPSCKKDNNSASSGGSVNTNPIIGTWSEPAYAYNDMMRRDEAYYFINDNTVTKLGVCYNQPYVVYFNGSPLASFETPVPTHSGWYYKGGNTMVTYTFEDNKIWMTDGTIFTYMNGKLYKDNANVVLEKW